MRRSPVLGSLFTVALALGAGACSSGDGDPEDFRDEVIEEFRSSEIGFEQDQAECAADVLIDVVGEDELKDIDFSAEEPPDELAEAFTQAGSRIVADCDIDLSGE